MKFIYLIESVDSESYSSFSARILGLLSGVKDSFKPVSMWVTITHEPPPVFSVIPFKKKKLAAISLISGQQRIIEDLVNDKGFQGLYEADEALPVSYDKTWSNGEFTPGGCLLTLFKKKEGITYDLFLHRWHNSHTPLSLRIHPLWHYNRNVVKPLDVKGPVIWDGIVEEHFRRKEDLLNPFRFFGNPVVILPRMIEVYRDTRSFIDYKTIEPLLTREYHV